MNKFRDLVTFVIHDDIYPVFWASNFSKIIQQIYCYHENDDLAYFGYCITYTLMSGTHVYE